MQLLLPTFAKISSSPVSEAFSELEHFSLFSSSYHSEIIGDIFRNAQKASASVLMSLYD